MDTKPKENIIRIYKYVGDLEIALDSVKYRGETSILFAYDTRYSDGVYLLEIGELESFQFVLVDKKNLNAHIYESGSGMAFRTELSKENDAFNIMLNLSDVYSQNMDSLSLATDRLNEFDPRHTFISDSLNTAYHHIAQAYNNSLGLLNELFPKSYAAQVLVGLDKIPLRSKKKEWKSNFDNDAAFNHINYFHYVNFNDERIITNPFLTNKVLEYLYNYTQHSETGIKESINLLLAQPHLHPKVQAYIIDLFIDFFSEKEATEFIDYISRTYLGNCKSPLTEETLEKIRTSVKFNFGDQIPMVKIAGQTGTKIPISTLNRKLNVVAFWGSQCTHCIREMPQLQALYNQMKGDLGVYAISIDTLKSDWITAIDNQQFNWLNVNDPDGWNSKYVNTFGITSTPTLFLLDADLRFIGRASSFDGLNDIVKKHLKP